MEQVVLNGMSAELAAFGRIIIHGTWFENNGKIMLPDCKTAFSVWICCLEVRPFRQEDFSA